MIEIRAEQAGDWDAIYELHRQAFGRDNEGRLVNALRAGGSWIPELSLVAIREPDVVGHILFSRIDVGGVGALALAPMAVLPHAQKQGIGSTLVRRGLEECRRLGHGIVIVVGHPAYYPRFGFTPARARGLEAPFPVPDDAFLVLELTPGVLVGVRGMVRYPAEFIEV